MPTYHASQTDQKPKGNEDTWANGTCQYSIGGPKQTKSRKAMKTVL